MNQYLRERVMLCQRIKNYFQKVPFDRRCLQGNAESLLIKSQYEVLNATLFISESFDTKFILGSHGFKIQTQISKLKLYTLVSEYFQHQRIKSKILMNTRK